MPNQTDASHVLSWDEFRAVADEAFDVWFGHPELRWAEEAWAILTSAGLTSYGTTLDFCRVCLRFFSLAGLYRDFCYRAFDEETDPDYVLWADMLEFHPFYIGQLVGPEDQYSDDQGKPYIVDALRVLADGERATVVKALLAHYGDESMLFIALWRSRLPIQSPFAGAVEDEAEWEETDWEIVNVPTDGKLAAYGWLTDGAYPNLPRW